MVKKSAAQIRRCQRRAEERGESYTPPSEATSMKPDNNPSEQTSNPTDSSDNEVGVSCQDENIVTKNILSSQQIKMRLKAGKQLTDEMFAIVENTKLNAKERRSAKRKAEVLAGEIAGCSASELMEWYNLHQNDTDMLSVGAKNDKEVKVQKNRKIPYTAFIGQLSYETTADDLFLHIQSELKNDKDFNTTLSREKLKVRLLTDSKTKKSRGMAFVEVDEPETLYALLKLHHTYLKGRRINVERTTGGGQESRKRKISSLRKEQEQYIKDTVQSILQEYIKRGEIQPNGELDDGVIALCSRHSPAIVEAALERYVESNGRDMDNSSAYLSFLLGKLASEGVFNFREDEKQTTRKGTNNDKKKSSRSDNKQPSKRPRMSK